MKKFIFLLFAALFIIIGIISVSAEESAGELPEESYEVVTEAVTESVESNAPEDESFALEDESFALEDESNIIDAIVSSESREESILKIAALLGCSKEEAEQMLDLVIEYGDKYFGENSTWIGLKDDIESNRHFWALLIIAVAVVVALFVNVLLLITKIRPDIRNTKHGVITFKKSVSDFYAEDSKRIHDLADSADALFSDIREENEASLKLVEQMTQRQGELLSEIDKKDEVILELQNKLSEFESVVAAAQKASCQAELYNLDILYLITRRIALPITDHSMIDLWRAKAIEHLEGTLGEEEVRKIEEFAAMINPAPEVEEGAQA